MRVGPLETIFNAMSAGKIGKILASGIVCGLIPLMIASKLPEDTPLLLTCAGGAAAGLVIAVFLTWPRAASGMGCLGVAAFFFAVGIFASAGPMTEATTQDRLIPALVGLVPAAIGISLIIWAYRRAKAND